MAKANAYEYGVLEQISEADFVFYYNGDRKGKTYNPDLYTALNELARQHWEPCLYYPEPSFIQKPAEPTFIMRREE
jgi:hypothetical protein